MYKMSEREAFKAMILFLNQYAEQAGDDLLTLLGDTSLDEHGNTFDPAAWEDWMRCVEQVLSATPG
jgi:hypothetical protein